jgi:hypothetical protein
LRGETADVNGNGKLDTGLSLDPGKFTFARPGTEQDVLAEYLGDRFSTNAYGVVDVGSALDTRIQNLTLDKIDGK